MRAKKDIEWVLMNFRCPKDIYEHLKSTSKDNYLSMTDYLIQILLKDMKKESKTNDIK